MSVHLINLTEAFIPLPLFPASLSLRKFQEKKTDSRETLEENVKGVADQDAVDEGFPEAPLSGHQLRPVLKPGSDLPSLLRKRCAPAS